MININTRNFGSLNLFFSKHLPIDRVVKTGNEMYMSEKVVYKMFFNLFDFDEALEVSKRYAKNKIDLFAESFMNKNK